MATKSKFKSDAFEAIHSSASALHRVGASNKATMRKFDESCLTVAEEIAPSQIKKIRESNHVIQPIFERHLNTSASTVQKWEAGAKRQVKAARIKRLVVIAKAGTPVARLSPIKAPAKALPYGLLKGKLKMRTGFDDPLPLEIAADFGGR